VGGLHFPYTDFLAIPQSFSKDIDSGWHLNPWADAIQRLSAENRQWKAVLLLVTLPLSRMILRFIAFAVGDK